MPRPGGRPPAMCGGVACPRRWMALDARWVTPHTGNAGYLDQPRVLPLRLGRFNGGAHPSPPSRRLRATAGRGRTAARSTPRTSSPAALVVACWRARPLRTLPGAAAAAGGGGGCTDARSRAVRRASRGRRASRSVACGARGGVEAVKRFVVTTVHPLARCQWRRRPSSTQSPPLPPSAEPRPPSSPRPEKSTAQAQNPALSQTPAPCWPPSTRQKRAAAPAAAARRSARAAAAPPV